MIPTFESEWHEYSVEGVKWPSVTQVLYAAGLGASHWQWLDKWYLERGSLVHMAIELELRDALDWTTLDPVLEPYLERFCRWRDLVNFKPVFVEQPLAHPDYLYCGTPDAFGHSELGPILVDWKTGAPDVTGRLQLAAYDELVKVSAEAEEFDGLDVVDVHRCRWLLLPLDQDIPKPVEVPISEKASNQRVFFSALETYRWREANGRL